MTLSLPVSHRRVSLTLEVLWTSPNRYVDVKLRVIILTRNYNNLTQLNVLLLICRRCYCFFRRKLTDSSPNPFLGTLSLEGHRGFDSICLMITGRFTIIHN